MLCLVAIAVLAVAACGKHPTAPKADPCVTVDTLWRENGAVLLLTTRYFPPCPRPK